MLHTNKPPYLGAAYYPELWPAEQVDQDIWQMKAAGCNLMRIAEFAWITMEPREGIFEFAWLQNVLDKLHAADIAVILCTPTATPPQWLTTKYPETLLMRTAPARCTAAAGITARTVRLCGRKTASSLRRWQSALESTRQLSAGRLIMKYTLIPLAGARFAGRVFGSI